MNRMIDMEASEGHYAKRRSQPEKRVKNESGVSVTRPFVPPNHSISLGKGSSLLPFKPECPN